MQPPDRAPSTSDAARYGMLGLPLAFASLPLYVHLPRHHAEVHALPLAALGLLLLATRLLDALIDPALGRFVDARFARSAAAVRALGWALLLLMALGFAALWLVPPGVQGAALWAWLAAALLTCCLGYSGLSLLHQAWGARLGGDAGQRTRVVAWREGAALAGVLLASVLPAWLGWPSVSLVLAGLLLLGWWLLWRGDFPGALADRPASPMAQAHAHLQVQPWRHRDFMALLSVFVVNGTASAIPATLLPFFVRDSLQQPSMEPLFLLAYFAAAAAGLPLWTRAAQRFGLLRCWWLGMGLSVLAFAPVPWLGAGDGVFFVLICLGSGLALGADLTMPSALLAGLIHRRGLGRQSEGAFFGWILCAAKLNLALAAGLALPLLGWAGYQMAASSPEAEMHNRWLLALAYGALPCGFKILAALALWRAQDRHSILKEMA